MVTDRSCNNKLVTTELVVQCRKSQVTYGVTGMKNYKNVKCVQKSALKCAHFSPKIKCVSHVRNKYGFYITNPIFVT